MKKKSIIVITTLLVIIIAAVIMNIVSQKEMRNTVYQETLANETSQEEKEETADSIEETKGNEVSILESTPESVIMDVNTEDGQDIRVEIGGISEDVFPDEPEDDSSQENPSNTVPTIPQEPEFETKPQDPTETPVNPPQANEPNSPNTAMSFAEYEAMSPEEQLMFYYSFADAEAFQAWYNAAKAEHDANNGDIIIGSDGAVTPGGNG